MIAREAKITAENVAMSMVSGRKPEGQLKKCDDRVAAAKDIFTSRRNAPTLVDGI